MADDECAINKITADETFFEDEAEVTEFRFVADENTGNEIASVEIQMETPLESHGVSMTSSEISNVKPKRLSDEFSSLDEETDDIDDEDEEDEEEEDNEKHHVELDLTSTKGEIAHCSGSKKTVEITEDDDDVEDDEDDDDDEEEEEKSSNALGETSSSSVSLCYSNASNNVFVQSIDDAIERADFEHEQRCAGRAIRRVSEFQGANGRLNFDLINNQRSAESREINEQKSADTSASSSSSSTCGRSELTSTPTSSRANVNERNKSTIRSKQKLSDKYLSDNNFQGESSASTTTATTSSSSSPRDGEHSKTSVKINLFEDEPSTSSGQRKIQSVADVDQDDCGLNDDYMEQNNETMQLNELIDEDNWVDCDSDIEEICTCQNYSDDECGASSSSSEDELPSRDVDLSSYTQPDPISDDIFHDTTDGTPKVQRKRKVTENSIESPISSVNRKRLALDSTPSVLSSLSITPKSSKTPRLIPTKDNPPPELAEWLLQFQRWTNAERLVAVDRLIEHCEPTQVRHMMKVIEPQFQRDFISLLPREVALHVLSYLEPKDLLRAAQTCRSWRFLADDNLLWKEKCRKSGIINRNGDHEKPRRGRTGTMPKIASPWKAAYMRHITIETNWRSNLIRTPKVLNGHDEHVITCLQFCGNRIVSGSDDNTLKVWSAVTGKCLRTLIGHTGGVWSSQMSEEGNIIISGSTDRTLKVWDAESGLCKHTLYGHTSTVRCMHLHGSRVVSGNNNLLLLKCQRFLISKMCFD
jgi:F-box and WD-40 domain protein 7